MRLLMRPFTHLIEPRRILYQRLDLACQVRSKLIVVADYYCPAAFFKHARVVNLLLILVEGIRHENGRTRAKSNIGNCHRA